MITVSVNHNSKTIVENASLSSLLLELNISTDGVAVAINNQVITKKDWESTQLNQNDTITIIQATQGG